MYAINYDGDWFLGYRSAGLRMGHVAHWNPSLDYAETFREKSHASAVANELMDAYDLNCDAFEIVPVKIVRADYE